MEQTQSLQKPLLTQSSLCAPCLSTPTYSIHSRIQTETWGLKFVSKARFYILTSRQMGVLPTCSELEKKLTETEELLQIPSVRSWTCYFRLWCYFAAFAVRRLLACGCSLRVEDNEVLGRAIFDRKLIKKASGSVGIGAFLVPPKQQGISVDRLDCAPRGLLERRAGIDGQRRATPQTFKGYAELRAAEVRKIRLSIDGGIPMRPTPKIRNPAHADFALPRDDGDDGDDLRMEIAEALRERARFAAPQTE